MINIFKELGIIFKELGIIFKGLLIFNLLLLSGCTTPNYQTAYVSSNLNIRNYTNNPALTSMMQQHVKVATDIELHEYQHAKELLALNNYGFGQIFKHKVTLVYRLPKVANELREVSAFTIHTEDYNERLSMHALQRELEASLIVDCLNQIDLI